MNEIIPETELIQRGTAESLTLHMLGVWLYAERTHTPFVEDRVMTIAALHEELPPQLLTPLLRVRMIQQLEPCLAEEVEQHDGAEDEDIEALLISQVIADALRRLSKEEQTVIGLYFGFNGRDPLSMNRIAYEMDTNDKEVARIKARALAALRNQKDPVFQILPFLKRSNSAMVA